MNSDRKCQAEDQRSESKQQTTSAEDFSSNPTPQSPVNRQLLGFITFTACLLAWLILTQIYSSTVETSPKRHRDGPGQAPVFLLDINQATAGQLQALPDVGPRLAERICQYRAENGSFYSVDQLLEVRGLGRKTIEKLRPMLTIGDEASESQVAADLLTSGTQPTAENWIAE